MSAPKPRRELDPLRLLGELALWCVVPFVGVGLVKRAADIAIVEAAVFVVLALVSVMCGLLWAIIRHQESGNASAPKAD